MRKFIYILSVVLIITSCALTATNRPVYSNAFYAMGTDIRFTVYDTDETTAKYAVSEAMEYINIFEEISSAKLTDSQISLINNNKKTENISDELYELIKISAEWSKKTNGTFDITLYNLISLWGADTINPYLPSDEKIIQALNKCGYQYLEIKDNTINLNNNIKLDLGAVAKGYAAGKAAEILKKNGIESAVINLGGDICLIGKKGGGNWSVWITDPLNPSETCAVIRLSEKSVATSASYERYFEHNGIRYHHIFDSRTGYPAESGIISSTVITDDPALADILSTAFYVMGAEKAAEFKDKYLLNNVDYILIDDTGKHILSEGFSLDYEYRK